MQERRLVLVIGVLTGGTSSGRARDLKSPLGRRRCVHCGNEKLLLALRTVQDHPLGLLGNLQRRRAARAGKNRHGSIRASRLRNIANGKLKRASRRWSAAP